MSPPPDFCYPLKPIENERLRIEPFDLATHGPLLFEAVAPHPDLYQYLQFGPFTALSDLEAWHRQTFASDPLRILFAIFAKRDGQAPEFAGTVGLLECDVRHAATEVGYITVVPKYQRTFVATNAVGLMLRYTLDAPEDGGLGLRRVAWQANMRNEPSIRLAKRMGFTWEGVARWQRVLPVGKAGNGVDVGVMAGRWGGEEQRPGRDSALLSMCWDDWVVDGKRGIVMRLMERKV